MSREFSLVDCEQRSPEWFAARAGRVTGSKARIVLMGERTDTRNDYALQLALERLTGRIEPEPYFSKDMQHGIDTEAWCRLQTEIDYGLAIRQTGFCRHTRLMIGMSFDGDINDFETFAEFKAPKTRTHLGYLRARKLPPEYKAQIMHGHLVSGARHSIFCSGDNRLPAGLDRFYVETNANDLPLEEYEKALARFLDQVSDTEAELRLIQQGKL